MALRTEDVKSAKLLHAFAELDVRAASCHVRRDRHSALLTRVLDDLRFLLMILCIEHIVRHAVLLQDGAELFRLRDGRRADEDRLSGLVNLFDRLSDGTIFRTFRLVDGVRLVNALHRTVRRHDDDGQLVNLEELVLLGLRRARHAAELSVHAEIVLKGDRGERLALALNLHAFLRFDRLVQSVRVTSSDHESSRELIDDDDLIIAHDIIAVALHQRLGAQRRREAVRKLQILGRVKILYADDALHLQDGFICRRDSLLLLVHLVVLALFELGDSARHDRVHIRGLLSRPRDDERRPRLINKNRVHLIDDGVMEIALHHLLRMDDHVVAQIVKAELVVRAERDVGRISKFSLRKIHIVRDKADG